MTTQEKRSLMDPVRECVLELQALGHYTTREVVNLIQERYPESLQKFQDRLIYDALAQLVRQVNKSPLPEQNGQAYLFLPRDVARRLPQAISIVTEEEDGGSQAWIPTGSATFNELEIHIGLLEISIARDQKKLEAMVALRNGLAPIMADSRCDEPIGPVAEELGIAVPAE